jgi:hypothetical protein
VANIVTLQQVKTHLRYPSPATSSTDDAALQIFINAADEVLEYECDDILPHAHDETYDGGNTTIFLRNIPILEVQNVEEGWGYINYELDFVQTNSPGPFSLFAYSVDNEENGEISRRTAGNIVIPFRAGDDNIRVTYTSGMSSLPGSIILAELELIAHWWQNSQLRAATMAGANLAYDSVGGAIYSRDTESGTQTLNIGVPYRILEQLKSRRHRPFFA